MITRAVILAVIAVLSQVVPAAAQTRLTFPKTPILGAALQAAQSSAGSAVPPSIPGNTGPRMALTMDEAVRLALEHNLDIAVAKLNPSTYNLSLASLEAVYRPTITSSVSTQAVHSIPTTTVAGGQGSTAIVQGTQTFNAGLTQGIPWGGGTYSIALNNTRQTTTSLNSLYNPSLTPNWSGTFTQPVLRNFRIDNTRQQLQVTKLNQDISDIQVQAIVTNTMANVRNAYWDYVFALQSIDVAQQSLALAEELVRNNQTRVQIGTLAPIDVVQAQSQAAAQRQTLVTAQGTARTAEITLKRLLVSGTADPMWTSTLDPVERPEFRAETVDVAAAIQHAQSTRTDVLQAKKNLAINDVTLRYLRDQTHPQLDVVGRYGLTAQGGTHLITSSDTVNRGEVIGIERIGYFDALGTLLKNTSPQWSVALNFSYPLGMSAQDAAIARARIQQNQVDAQLRQLDLQVATDVTNAAVNVQNSVERVQAAQAAHDLAQQQLDAENSKFNVGMSTNFNIVQAQRDLATARNNELQAILAYRKELVEFERVQETGTAGNVTLLGR